MVALRRPGPRNAWEPGSRPAPRYASASTIRPPTRPNTGSSWTSTLFSRSTATSRGSRRYHSAGRSSATAFGQPAFLVGDTGPGGFELGGDRGRPASAGRRAAADGGAGLEGVEGV